MRSRNSWATSKKLQKANQCLSFQGLSYQHRQGRLLVYAPTWRLYVEIIGQLTFDSDRRACRIQSAVDVLRHVEANSGLAIMAHIDLDSGLEAIIYDLGNQKRSIICSRTLVAVEISSLDALDWYSPADPVEGRRQILEERLRTLGSPFASDLAKVRATLTLTRCPHWAVMQTMKHDLLV